MLKTTLLGQHGPTKVREHFPEEELTLGKNTVGFETVVFVKTLLLCLQWFHPWAGGRTFLLRHLLEDVGIAYSVKKSRFAARHTSGEATVVERVSTTDTVQAIPFVLKSWQGDVGVTVQACIRYWRWSWKCHYCVLLWISVLGNNGDKYLLNLSVVLCVQKIMFGFIRR